MPTTKSLSRRSSNLNPELIFLSGGLGDTAPTYEDVTLGTSMNGADLGPAYNPSVDAEVDLQLTRVRNNLNFKRSGGIPFKYFLIDAELWRDNWVASLISIDALAGLFSNYQRVCTAVDSTCRWRIYIPWRWQWVWSQLDERPSWEMYQVLGATPLATHAAPVAPYNLLPLLSQALLTRAGTAAYDGKDLDVVIELYPFNSDPTQQREWIEASFNMCTGWPCVNVVGAIIIEKYVNSHAGPTYAGKPIGDEFINIAADACARYGVRELLITP